VFRDKTGKLKSGRRIAFAVACKKQDDEIPAGGTIWKPLEQLVKAKYLEVALDGDKAVWPSTPSPPTPSPAGAWWPPGTPRC